MSKTKELFDWAWRAMTEFGMIDSPHDEVIAFATGLRDGKDGMNTNPYSDVKLHSFYKQGFKHGGEEHGFKV
jgi:hypothetical protein